MAPSNRSFFSTLAGRITASVVALVLILGLMFFTENEDVDPFIVAPDETVTSKERQCEQDLARVIDGMKPGNLELRTKPETIVNRLNRWALSCRLSDEDAEKLQADQAVFDSVLLEVQSAPSTRKDFGVEDVIHIQQCLLSRQIVDHVTKDLETEGERISALFSFVSRYIQLSDAQSSYTPYEAFLFGRGTAEDRAWAFAALLKQIRIDAVILRPTGDESVSNPRWLVGVITPKSGILLFDPTMGMMVPSTEDDSTTPTPTRPATLEEVKKGDAAFRLLDLPGNAYPLNSKQFSSVQIELIGSSSSWSDRMAALQFMLPSDLLVDVYQGLSPNALNEEGSLQRIANAGEGVWTREDIKIWSHPEQQLKSRTSGNQELAILFEVFTGPNLTKVLTQQGSEQSGSFNNDQVVVNASKSLHEVRIEQLTGENYDALKDYFPLRNVMNRPSSIMQTIGDLSVLWTGMCQMELERYSAAIGTFRRYSSYHPDGDAFVIQASEWAAESAIQLDDFPTAIELLAKAPKGADDRKNAYLIRRWALLASGGQQVPKETPEPEPMPTKPAPKPSPMPPESKKSSETPASTTSTNTARPSAPSLPERIDVKNEETP